MLTVWQRVCKTVYHHVGNAFEADGGEAVDQAAAATCPIDAFNRLTEAGEMPANRLTSLTPLPAISPSFAFSTFTPGMGGRPNLTDAARAAACPRRTRSRRDWRRWKAIMPAASKSDRPLLVSASIPCSCRVQPHTSDPTGLEEPNQID